jgi:hypothetical protein
MVSIVAFFAVAGQSYAWLDVVKNDSRFQRDDYRGMAAVIEQTSRSGDAIILNAPNQYEVFTYYYEDDLPIFPLPRGYGGDDTATRAEVQQVIADHQRIFVLFWGEGERDPNSIVKNTLDTEAYEVYTRWYGNVRLVLYAVLESPPDEPSVELNQPFGEHITLEGYAIIGVTSPGSVMGVTLFWSTDAPLETRYSVSVQLLSPDGRLIDQHDAEPANYRQPTPGWQPGDTIVDNHGILIPPSLTPGAGYSIIVVMYESDNPGTRLSVGNNDSLELEKVTIE